MRALVCWLGKLFFSGKMRRIVENPKKILVFRSGAIGDVLMTTPFLKSLRTRYPKAEIVYLVGNWSRSALDNNPSVDRIISFDDSILFKKKIFQLIKFRSKVVAERFDLCFILDKSYLFNIFAYLCRIPSRIGFDRKGEGFANSLSVDYSGAKCESEYYLDLIALVRGKRRVSSPKLYPTSSDKIFVQDLVVRGNLTGKNLIGIAPGGAENPGQKMHLKRWPEGQYARLIKRLSASKKTMILLFGGDQDKELIDAIIKKTGRENVLNLAGRLTLHQSSLLMKKCKLFVTHDSGPLHIAATARIPIVALFGPTPAQRFAPRNAVVVRSPSKKCPCYNIYGRFTCDVDCMSLISVEEVMKREKQCV